ncbi:MAG: MFS transporter [Desulfobulbaceae bacterium]|nr:MFS transporter [Desulfobulbaceae bacterium]
MRSDVKIIWLVSFSHMITHGYMTILPAVLVAIATEQSMGFMELGLVANIGYFLYGLGAFPAGYLADRLGSKRLLTFGILGMAVSSICIGLSSSLLTFAVAYTMLGIFASIHHPAGLSLIARRITEKKGKAMGAHGVMGNIGLFLSPLVAASSIMVFGTWRAAYFSFGVLGLAFFFLLYFARVAGEKNFAFRELTLSFKRTEPVPAGESAEKAAAGSSSGAPFYISAALLVLFIGSILSGFIFRGSLTFLPALFQQNITAITYHDQPVVMAGYTATAILSLGLIGAWFGGYINDRIRYPEFVPVCIFLIAAPALYFASRLMGVQLLASTGLFSLVYYAWQPSHNYLIAKYTKKSSQGMGFGVNFFLIFGMGSLATSIGGWVSDDIGVDRFYAYMALIGVAAMFAAMTVYPLRAYVLKFKSPAGSRRLSVERIPE